MEELAKEKKQQKTDEDELAEKLRQRKLQEVSDLAVAMDTFGVAPGVLDSMDPKLEEDFDKFREALCDKITAYEVSTSVIPQYSSHVLELFIAVMGTL